MPKGRKIFLPAHPSPQPQSPEDPITMELQDAEIVAAQPNEARGTNADDEAQPSHIEDEETTGPEEEASLATGTFRWRKKSPNVVLSDEVEAELGEWLQEHPSLYDKGILEWRDRAKKDRYFQAKAKSLDPPLTTLQLKTWLDSIRSRFGRLTKLKSGQRADKPLTEREKWILQVFQFLGRHIARVSTLK